MMCMGTKNEGVVACSTMHDMTRRRMHLLSAPLQSAQQATRWVIACITPYTQPESDLPAAMLDVCQPCRHTLAHAA